MAVGSKESPAHFHCLLPLLTAPDMKLPNLLTLLLLVLAGANYFGCLTDLDWSWQVRTGQLIAESGSLRTHDTFSYTLDGKLLHDFEWLWEVLLWHTWNLFGLGGLKLLRVLVVATPLTLLGWRLNRDGLRWHVVVLALVSAFYVLSPAWNLRPLYCTTIGLFLCWSLLHDHCTGRAPLSWWALPLVMLLWANMHPGVITGQALICGAIAWEWLYFVVRRSAEPEAPAGAATNRSASGLAGASGSGTMTTSASGRAGASGSAPLNILALWRLTCVGGIALAATLISPDPFDRFLYPFSPDLKHPIFRIFIEMQPLHRFLFQQPVVAPVVYAMAALVLLTVVKRFRHYRAWELALLAGAAFLGSVAVRSLMDWYVIMLALGLPHAKAMYVEAVKRRPMSGWLHGLLRLDNSMKRMFEGRLFCWQPAWVVAGVGVLAGLTVMPGLGRDMPLRDSPEWPVAALDHIEKSGVRGNFFAGPDYGAYIGWRLKGQAKTYMDTRGFFFPPTLVEDSHYVPAMGPQWRMRLARVLDEYPTEYFLLETWGVRGRLWHALQPHIADPLYRDDKTVLLTARQVRQGVAKLQEQVAAR